MVVAGNWPSDLRDAPVMVMRGLRPPTQ